MPITTTNLWKAEPNTKVPALSHFFSFRVSGLTSLAANGSQTVTFPNNYSNVGQNAVVSGNPAASAPSASAYDPNSEPQYAGATFVPSHLMIRSPNGVLVSSGALAAGTLAVTLYNQNVSAISATAVTRTPGTLQAYSAGVNGMAQVLLTASTSTTNVVTPEVVYESSNASALQATQTAGALTGVSPVLFRPGMGDTLALNVTVASYAAGGTATPTATAFTVDCFGYWLQTI